VRLRTFGGLGIEGAAQELGGAAGQRRPLALLLLVATGGNRGVSRDKLMSLLWPESDDEHARSALRQTLHSLRRDLGLPELFVGTTDLRLNAALLPSDVAEFDAAIAHGDSQRAVALYAAPLADGFHLSKAPEFERWLEDERRLRAQQFATAIERLADDATRRGDPEEAAALWRKLAVQERLSSRVAIQLMEALAAAGDREAAIQHARVHEALVRAELEVAPDPAVAALAERLRSEAGRTPQQPAVRRPLAMLAEESITLPPAAVSTSAARRDSTLQEVPSQAPRKALWPAGPSIPVVDAEVPLRTVNEPSSARADSVRTHAATGWRRALAWPLAAAALGAVIAAGTILTRPSDAPALEASLYAVMPFAHAMSDSAKDLLGEDCQLLLGNAFSHWQGVQVVDGMRVKSAYEQFVGRRRPDLGGVLDAARSLRAGVAVWGEVRPIADSIYVRAALYDVAREGRTIREHQVSIARNLRDLSDAKRKFRQLADSLLLSSAGAPVAADAIGTSSYDAYRAYAEGYRALGEWDLAEARRWFERAIELDPQFPHAYLWLVQATSLEGMLRGPEWRLAAAQAAALRERLAPPDREFAVALLDLAEGRFQDACRRYQRIVARDSLDFRAWYGLGECQALDELVVEDRRSPSGWRFRSSQGAAIAAYTRALALTPVAHRAFRGRSFERLSALLFVHIGRVKRGYRFAGGDTVRYAAFPTLEHDTLAFVPYLVADIRARMRARIPQSLPVGHAAAVMRNRETLRGITEGWVRAFPLSPDAAEGHIRALEATNELTNDKPPSRGALDVVRGARRLARDPDQRFRLATTEVRLLLKTSDYAAAARLADSLLAAPVSRHADGLRQAAAVAALVGKVHRAAALFAESGPSPGFPILPAGTLISVPAAVLRPALSLYAYAAFGSPRDSIRALWNRVGSAVRMWVPAGERERASLALLYEPAAFAYGTIGPTSLHRQALSNEWGIVEVQAAAMRGDTSVARAQVDADVALQRADPSRPIAPQSVLQYAHLMLAGRDTARAAAMLDALLDGIPIRPEGSLQDPIRIASIIRAMALRAELAAAARDASRASRWAAAVATLWRNADRPLAESVTRARAIAAQYRRR
jgi:DNA-binding SARP family transcriptional activator